MLMTQSERGKNPAARNENKNKRAEEQHEASDEGRVRI
jgi:hypothetical protein